MNPDKSLKEGFRGYGNVKVIETTHGSLQLHIPAKIRDDLKLNKTMRMHVDANKETNQIVYSLVKDED